MSFPNLWSLRIHLPVVLGSAGITRFLRYYDDSDSCCVLADTAGIPSSRYRTFQTFHLQPPHISCISLYPALRLCRVIQSPFSGFGLRHLLAGSPIHTAESSSLFCGLPFRFPLLSTRPHGHAVTVGCKLSNFCLTRTCTLPIQYARRRTGLGRQPVEKKEPNYSIILN